MFSWINHIKRNKSPLRTVRVKIHWPQKEEYEISLDIASQVLKLIVPEDRDYPHSGAEGPVEAAIASSFDALNPGRSRFLSAAALAFKAKQLDDGIYAAVELAATRGKGKFSGKATFIRTLLEKTLMSGETSGAEILAAAAALGGGSPDIPAGIAGAADEQRSAFLKDPACSKPLGFYTWSAELRCVFQRDRMLQTELGEAAANSIAGVLSADPALLEDYRAILDLAARLTNPFAKRDLREAVGKIARGVAIEVRPPVCVFPPSRAHETDIVKELYPDRPAPDGFNLADELIRRIRDRRLKLEPGKNSGWYDYQTYALEPLAIPDKIAEAERLTFTDSYRKELAGLFRALLFLTRETHVKQLERPAIMMEGPGREVVLDVSPDLTVEPLPTYYLRRARSCRFVRRLLEGAFGNEGVHDMRRLTADGPTDLPLDEEIRFVEALFHGAYLETCREIGLGPEENLDLGSGKGPAADRMLFERWRGKIDSDQDLARDIRMMVPVFYDLSRKKTKAWVVLGVAAKPFQVSYEKCPRVLSVRRSDGTVVDRSQVKINFGRNRHELAYVVSAEVYVDRILDREEFRAHCDRYKTFRVIVENLE
jgi:hypothetical protein